MKSVIHAFRQSVRPVRARAGLAFACAAAAILPSAVAAAAPQTVFDAPDVPTLPTPNDDFEILDTVQGSNVDLVLWSIDGMTFNTDGTKLFVTNPYGGRVLRFSPSGGAPDLVIDVPWGVTSLAYWVSPADDHEELLAIGRGNYGLTRIDPSTGAIFDYVQLPTEPADILVEPVSGHVFVSCSGDDVVLELDLDSGAIHDVFDLVDSRNFAFLSTDGSGDVYVAPMTSGNNSMAMRGGLLGHDQAGNIFQVTPPAVIPFPVLDMSDSMVSSTGLPDVDLVRLIPSSTAFSGTQEVAATGLGTNLFGHGIHPGTGDFWILNTEANNKVPNEQSEAAIRGEIVTNRITITTLGSTPPGEGDHAYVSLDDMVIPPASTGSGEAVGQPYDLWFASDDTVYVIGLLTDNLVQVDDDGDVLEVWDLDPGSIPRDLIVDETNDLAYVYCWGSNEVVTVDLSTGVVGGTVFDLGYDPTSPLRKAGRAIFYDGHNSANGNASCESCHIEVGTDFLAWNLTDPVKDDKGPMETQMLRGIAPLNPYHWRGERADLVDFNVAFDGLLGGTELDTDPGEEFDQFAAFVFGTAEPANPRTSPYRKIVDSGDVLTNFNVKGDTLHGSLSAINGQTSYFETQSVGVNTCQECHTLPTGTANDFFHDGIIDQDHRSSLDVPAYNGLWRKEQKSRHDVDVFGSTQDRPPLGSGTTHAGLRSGVYEFVTEVFGTLEEEERQDIALFMHQIDSGLAPAVHKAVLLDEDHQPDAEDYALFLRARALAGDCDLVAFGTVTTSTGVKSLRWFYDANLSVPVWICEDSGQPNRRLAYFVEQADNGEGSNMIVAVPIGMGRRWGIDADDDLLFDADENRVGTDPFDPDTDDDGFWDGLEVKYMSDPEDDQDTPTETDDPLLEVDRVYVTGRVAKLNLRTSEPTQVSVAYTVSGVTGDSSPITIDDWASYHTVLIRDLDPSYATDGVTKTVSVTVTVTDQSGNDTMTTLTSFPTEEFIIALQEADDPPIDETIVEELNFVSQAPETGGGFRLTYDGLLYHEKKYTNPELVDHAIVCRVFTQGASETEFTKETNFTIENFSGGSISPPNLFVDDTFGLGGPGGVYPGVGPFLVSPATTSGAPGEFELEFVLPDAVAGDQVLLVVESVAKVDPSGWPGDVTIAGGFHFPATPVDARCTDPVTLTSP